MKPPRIQGPWLKAARLAAENGATQSLLESVLKESLGLDRLKALPPSLRGDLPMDQRPLEARSERPLQDQGLGPVPATGALRSAQAIRDAFDAGTVGPSEVAARSRALAQKLRDNRVHNILVADDERRTTEEGGQAAERWKAKSLRGPLDGIPYLVKDEIDVAGLPTRVGSHCGPTDPMASDSTVVARLRAAGAVFVGKTVMTEWGMSPIGQNPGYPMPTNAHHAERAPGGSSSGSAVGVACGVAPLALGTDGGGSVRIPAALNGIFGIKPTFGRVSRTGSLSGSVGHVGPLGASTADLAAFLDVVASEPDPEDRTTLWARPPRGSFGARAGAGVKGLKVGVIEGEWAEASKAVTARCEEALQALEKEGATIIRVKLSLAAVAAPMGYLTIGEECLASHQDDWLHRRDRMGDDLRLSLAVLSGITALEFLDAQRLRTTLRRQTQEVFREVDLLALPTTVTTAPPISAKERGRAMADTTAIDALCRFNFLGNLTGLPAGSAPVGLADDGLPVGFQLIGDAWDEAIVLGAMSHLERIGVARTQMTPSKHDLLER